MPYDYDGEIPADMISDRDYCRHGVFVGGCGFDHMCHWCEMGEDPPTQAERDADKLRRAEQWWSGLVDNLDGVEPVRSRAWMVTTITNMALHALTCRSGMPLNAGTADAWERVSS